LSDHFSLGQGQFAAASAEDEDWLGHELHDFTQRRPRRKGMMRLSMPKQWAGMFFLAFPHDTGLNLAF
jgi:hypothetical protein